MDLKPKPGDTFSIYDALLFTSAQACEVAGIDQKTLKNWLSRDPVVIELTEAERRDAGQRIRFRFSFNRIIHIALTAELVRIGFRPGAAAQLGLRLIHTGKHEQYGIVGRIAGQLYAGVRTVLIGSVEKEAGTFVPVTKDAKFLELAVGSGFFVDISLLYARACSALRVKVDGGTLTMLPPWDEKQVRILLSDGQS